MGNKAKQGLSNFWDKTSGVRSAIGKGVNVADEISGIAGNLGVPFANTIHEGIGTLKKGYDMGKQAYDIGHGMTHHAPDMSGKVQGLLSNIDTSKFGGKTGNLMGMAKTVLSNKDIIRHTQNYLSHQTPLGIQPMNKVQINKIGSSEGGKRIAQDTNIQTPGPEKQVRNGIL